MEVITDLSVFNPTFAYESGIKTAHVSQSLAFILITFFKLIFVGGW